MAAARMKRREKTMDCGQRFQLAHDASQRRPVVMQFRFFHAALTIFIAEELEHFVESFFGLAGDVGESLPLVIVEKLLQSERNFGHGERLVQVAFLNIQILYANKL
jgi:hypothetical protein